MHTTHTVIFQDSRKLGALSDESIDLVITSPPYPMIEMWDEQFVKADPSIGVFLERGDSGSAFEAMHGVLDPVWSELYRVMKNGAFACINVGDATRTVKNRFQLFANRARVQQKLVDLGFDALPVILWWKQTNAPTKFMGSGMLPAGAYVTLEHEYILIFRKGAKRAFAGAKEKQNRLRSGYFWEERNTWFSDIWDLKGVRQELEGRELRGRSAAFPFLLPFRLINMYSVLGDTVLDPFLGTGTSAAAAMAAGRNSVGYEIEHGFSALIKKKIAADAPRLSIYNIERIKNHLQFIREHDRAKNGLKYINRYFQCPVMTRQERELKLVFVKSAGEVEQNIYRASYFDDEFIQSLKPLSFAQLQDQTDPANPGLVK